MHEFQLTPLDAFFSENRDEPAPPPAPPAPGRALLSEQETSINTTLFNSLEDPRLLENLHQFPNEQMPNLFTAATFGSGIGKHLRPMMGSGECICWPCVQATHPLCVPRAGRLHSLRPRTKASNGLLIDMNSIVVESAVSGTPRRPWRSRCTREM